jgi:hypothetical protein
MERTKWTDDLIDERMASIDHKLDRNLEESRLLRAEIGALRTDMNGQTAGLRTDLGREIAGLRTDLGREIAGLRADLGAEIAGLRTDLIGQIAGLRTDLGGQIADMRADLWRSQRQLTWIVVSFALALVGLFGALISKL